MVTEVPVSITVRVRNVGRRGGRAVAQAYLARLDADVERPVRWLAGFAAADLEPGSEAGLTIELASRALQHRDGSWPTEPGRYELLVGRSVGDLPLRATISVDG